MCRLRQIFAAHGSSLPEDGFMPLIAAFEVAMTAGQGAAMLMSAERDSLNRRYEQARDVIKDVKFDFREMALAA